MLRSIISYCLVSAFAILMLLSPALADKRIDEIRGLYQKARELDCGSDCEHLRHEIRLNTMLPASLLFFLLLHQLPGKIDSLNQATDNYNSVLLHRAQ